jgi:hypothetical protein
MRDCLLVALVLSTSTAIGYPACLLFPPQQFKARLVTAAATERHPGITAGGVYEIEKMAQGPLRWTSADARFQVANASDAPAAQVVLALWSMQLAADVHLLLTINKSPVFARPVPEQPVTVPLEAFAKDDMLSIELKTVPVTRYPHDPRELGVALRALRIEKSEQ